MVTVSTITISQNDKGDIIAECTRPMRHVVFVHASDGTPSVDMHGLIGAMFDAADAYGIDQDQDARPGPGQATIPGLPGEGIITNAGGVVTRVSHGYVP